MFCMNILGLAGIGYIDSPIIGKGDPNILIYGVDYKCNICGKSGNLESFDKRYVIYYYYYYYSVTECDASTFYNPHDKMAT